MHPNHQVTVNESSNNQLPAKPVVVEDDGDAWPESQPPSRAVAVRPLEATLVDVPATRRPRGKVAPTEAPLVFPAALEASEPFRAKWAKWVECRRAMRKPKRWDVLFQEQLDWLASYTPDQAVQILSASIMNGWQGLFPPKNGQNGHANGNGAPTGMDKRLWSEELKRVDDEIKRILSNYDSHRSVDFMDAAIIKGLREREKELKAKLGFKV